MRMAKKKPANPWRKRLKDLREQNGLTQTSAAERVGVSASTWIAWENGQRKPSKTAQRLIGILFPNQK